MSTIDLPQAAAPKAPIPLADQDSAFYWDGLRNHSLLLQECNACARRRFPPMPACPYCSVRGHHLVQPDARGTVYSWVVVHHAFHPAFKDDLPYVVATIDLEGGGRMATRVDTPTGLDFGQVVKATFVDHESWTELRFTPDSTA